MRGDFPDWLEPSLTRAFGGAAAEEGAALARRAPVDLRVNTLKADRDKVLKALARFGPEPTPLSPVGVRLPAPEGPGRQPNVEAEIGHGRGWYEVQDEGSQLAALMAAVGPRQQVLDICAGAGGKTLAFAAAMRNTGQVYAYDEDAARLRPIFERLKRAGARNVQVLQPGDAAAMTALGPRFDRVFVDAPCTGSGAWRRRPDAKWRLKPANLVQRQGEQRAILEAAAPMVKPGGRLVYATCSVLPEENGDQVVSFLANHSDFATLPWRRGVGRRRGWRAADLCRWQRGDAAPHAGAAWHRRVLHRRACGEANECCGCASSRIGPCAQAPSSTDKSLTGKSDGLIGSCFAETRGVSLSTGRGSASMAERIADDCWRR